jgi:hypothetical protein
MAANAAAARLRDAQLPARVDPYRVQYGMSEGAFVTLIFLAVFGGLGLLMFISFLIQSAR